ncbi:MAG: hypothetical protein N2606_04460 [Candidatus Omnitrophica bacterium]|nr:hypothetical protein [Candidatus Omnitrophota bacterium]
MKVKNFLLRLKFVLVIGISILSSSSCITFSPDEAIRTIMLGEPTKKYNTIKYDLDQDGRNEYLVTYRTGKHTGRIKVIKFFGRQAKVIFEYISNTDNIQFRLFSNVPTLIFQQTTYNPDYASGQRYYEIYQWDGTTFQLTEKKQTLEEE